MFKKAVALATVLICASLVFSAQAVSAKAYALVDQSSGRLIEGANTDERLPMASTTKIMTGLIACESGRLDETVTISAEEIRIEGSSMGLQDGEKLTLRELTYGLLLESGNDAANVIAVTLDGSVTAFAQKMNARARKLGLTGTHFANSSGLDAPEHYTTALDLARLGAAAMNNPEFAKIVGTRKIKIPYAGTANARTLFNHNRLLSTFDGMLGIKTGFTEKDGRCLVTCARRGGVTLVAATLKDPDDWDDHTKLLESGFARLKPQRLISDKLTLSAKVAGGAAETVNLECDPDVTAALAEGELEKVNMTVELPEFVYAPVKKGQKLGRLVFTVDGQTVAATPLTAADSVKQRLPEEIKGGIGAGAALILAAAATAAFVIYRKLKEKNESGT